MTPVAILRYGDRMRVYCDPEAIEAEIRKHAPLARAIGLPEQPEITETINRPDRVQQYEAAIEANRRKKAAAKEKWRRACKDARTWAEVAIRGRTTQAVARKQCGIYGLRPTGARG